MCYFYQQGCYKFVWLFAMFVVSALYGIVRNYLK
jgi:hypothetical protein